MVVPRENQSIPFESLPIGALNLGNTLFSDSCPSITILPLTHINTQIKQTKKQWLHKKELSRLNKFTYEKRHREWLGGRICSKQALHNFFKQFDEPCLPPEHQQYKVASEESGRPFFTGSKNVTFSFPELSISHSKDFAAALVSKTSCGIDIQYPAENLYRVKERFIKENEERLLQKMLPQFSPLQHLTLLWAGKEAVKKMLSPEGIPGFHELTLLKISPHDTSTAVLYFSRSEKLLLPVAAGILNNEYGLAFCCETKQPTTFL